MDCSLWFLPKTTAQKERKKEQLYCGEPDKHNLKWNQVVSHMDSMYPWYDVMRMYFTSVVFLPKIYYPSLMIRKASDKAQLGNTLHKTSLVLLKTAKAIKNKASPWNCHNQEETWLLIITQYPEWDPGQKEKGKRRLSE